MAQPQKETFHGKGVGMVDYLHPHPGNPYGLFIHRDKNESFKPEDHSDHWGLMKDFPNPFRNDSYPGSSNGSSFFHRHAQNPHSSAKSKDWIKNLCDELDEAESGYEDGSGTHVKQVAFCLDQLVTNTGHKVKPDTVVKACEGVHEHLEEEQIYEYLLMGDAWYHKNRQDYAVDLPEGSRYRRPTPPP